MLRDSLRDLRAFVALANEGSFTRAAGKLGISQSALSHTIRQLEAQVGVRLVARTTRQVSLTLAGEKLLAKIEPGLIQIEDGFSSLNELRDKPSGTLRIVAEDTALMTVLWPKLQKVISDYPDIEIEFVIDYGLTDIVADRFDAGVRLGEQLQNGMIAARIGPDMRLLVVGSPSYLRANPAPQSPPDLTAHNCINIRHQTKGAIYIWEFEKDGKEMQIRVQGQLTFNTILPVIRAAVDGAGLAYVPEVLAVPYFRSGDLIALLEDHCPIFPGYYLYYPSKRQHSAAFSVILEALRYRN
ncbi:MULTISPECIES: LysR family transcriptional regulator [unclassified Mesorhizobium]|uniref:LysR family transcriptional regulator n=1 Tax=unclassified Mesorhizobium TaxID=325217 RepID=UPI000FD7234C|nr:MULTISPECIES: LysR family transcriptional regulator [unclassified Mesorhizobium]TGR18799.1 LysR family transcriptional regulator [Mesorhizobium sp. M8A.F.Ca.ET.197.01.1.1]TGR37063.1 LysR family transcriptional regulator [bacterium M00.F.Ca.ET.199.01.1.1]TGR41599.1 LysR family transcriptional regulator [Mesorhizobium sp. M8A.F.Ca.ET.198.01.1.1]TGV85310.1 LysR family transcriptional regulator [Mesorhizobium sp. M00.F.Ca.ET.149.01.1.1]